MTDSRYLATLLTALAMACLLALSLFPWERPTGGSDVIRDAMRLRAR